MIIFMMLLVLNWSHSGKYQTENDVILKMDMEFLGRIAEKREKF